MRYSGIVVGLALSAPAIALALLASEALNIGSSGLVKVSSVNSDIMSGKKVPARGTGFIVMIKKQKFVLTAAHLTQGENLEIVIGKSKVSYRAPVDASRLAHSYVDLDLLELKPSLLTGPDGVALSAGALDEISRAEPIALYDPAKQLFVLSSHGKSAKANAETKYATLFNVSSDAHLLLGDWILNPGPGWQQRLDPFHSIDPAGVPKSEQERNLQYTFSGHEFFSSVKISPGMSGSPLIASVLLRSASGTHELVPVVLGVAKRYLLDFEKSYFSGEGLRSLVNLYRKGKRGRLGDARWRLRNCLTYLDYGGGTFEINPASNQAGNGQGMDGGEDQCETKEQEVHPITQDVWDRFAISPGVTWRGQPTLAFKATPSGEKSSFYVFANYHAIDLMTDESLKSAFKLEPVPWSLSFGSMLKDKLQTTPLKGTSARRDHCLITLHDKGIGIEIPVMSQEVSETLSIELDEQGSWISQNPRRGFRPVLHVPGPKSGNLYHVNIHGLFSVDLSLIPSLSLYTSSGWHSRNPALLRLSREAFIILKEDSWSDTFITCERE